MAEVMVDDERLLQMEARALRLLAVQLRELGVMLPTRSVVGRGLRHWACEIAEAAELKAGVEALPQQRASLRLVPPV